MLKSLNRYIKNNEFSINIWNKHVAINNFIDILSLEEDCIIASFSSGLVKITGNNISINRLSNNELLLCGDIKSIKLEE